MNDAEVQALITEPKESLGEQVAALKYRDGCAHLESDCQTTGDNGNLFSVRIRMSEIDPMDFSVILSHRLPGSTEWIILRRYNGSSHWHRNSIEGDWVKGFHIHTTTERYQALGGDPEGYAEPAFGYENVHEALDRLIADCAIRPALGNQLNLFTTAGVL